MYSRGLAADCWCQVCMSAVLYVTGWRMAVRRWLILYHVIPHSACDVWNDQSAVVSQAPAASAQNA